MPRVYAYRRISDEDNRSELGMDSQKLMVEGYWRFLQSSYPEVEWGGWLLDQESASKVPLTRREGGRVLNDLLQPGDHVIFARLDRAFRWLDDQTATLRQWKERGVTVHFAAERIDQDTIHGQLILNVLGSVNQWYAQYIGERNRETARRLKERGCRAGGRIPLGFRSVGPKGHKRLVPNAKERRIMQQIVEWKEAGWDFHRISQEIEEQQAAEEGRKPRGLFRRRWTPALCRRAWVAEGRLT